MKLTPTQAANKIREHLAQGNGIYIDSRFYQVRVKAGVLQVSDFNNWFDVAPGSVFRSTHGRDLFKYEPEEPTNTLTVVSVSGLKHPAWVEAFEVGATIEVIRETATQYVIFALDLEQRVSKKTGQIMGANGGHFVQFESRPEWYCVANGKKVSFDSLEKAKAFCKEVFAATGVILGIEQGSK